MTDAMHVEWVGIVIISRREDDPDSLVGGKDEGVLSNVEIGGLGSASEDFIERRGLGWKIRDTVDVPLGLSGGLTSSNVLSKCVEQLEENYVPRRGRK